MYFSSGEEIIEDEDDGTESGTDSYVTVDSDDNEVEEEGNGPEITIRRFHTSESEGDNEVHFTNFKPIFTKSMIYLLFIYFLI